MKKRIARTPERHSYDAMMRRCYCVSYEKYPLYGGRGITVCERWRTSFEAFLEDMGPRPPGRTLDRQHNNKPYEPSNCRWATPTQQSRNKRALAVGELKATAIRALKASGFTGRGISRAMGLAESTVRNVINRVSWAPEMISVPENDNGRARQRKAVGA